MYEVTARTTFPYSAICHIQVTFADGYNARGSGVVVGNNDVLTAQHVVYDASHGGYATSITVTPGADSSPFTAPFGSFSNWGNIQARTRNWDQNGDGLVSQSEAQYDMALIGMRVNIGATVGYMGLSNTSSDFSGTMAGYPARGTGLMAERVYADASRDYGVFDIDSGLGGGASGGPLFNDSNRVVGVLSSGNSSNTSSTYAALFAPGTWDWLVAAMASNDSLVGGSPAPAPSPSPAPAPSPAPSPSPSTTLKTGTTADDSWLFGSVLPPGALTISDPGGRDTFNAYLVNGNHTIDLNPGARSTIGSNTVTLTAGTVIEDVLAYNGNDIIFGNSADNTVWAEGGNDQLTGRGGNDWLEGGAGIDTAGYSGAYASYSITFPLTDMVAVTDRRTGGDGADTLVDIERLKFSDVYVALDHKGNAGMAYRLYQAAFNRTPDKAGLGFQMHEMDVGVSLQAVAQNFINSPEFARTYGALNNTQFVNQLYTNVLHRAADAGGLSYHAGNLAAGMSRAQVLMGFSESPENQAALIGFIQGGMQYTL
ncbi:MAG: DUF4214 domain-containing protein [Hylemonella sp.]|nr:DUF4214 domain-containing protein [Hylemonella sp.]